MRKSLIYLILTFVFVAVFALYMIVIQGGVDTRPPEIFFDGTMLELSAKAADEAYMQGVSATDDKDGDVTSSLVVESIKLLDSDGTIRITYAAFDAAGNVRKALRTARYTDYESPRFFLNRSLTFAYYSGFDIFNMVRAEDALDGNISHRVRITSMDDSSIANVGAHQVQLRVTNSLGETVQLVVPVEVYDPEWYLASVKLDTYLLYLKKGDVFNPREHLDKFVVRGADTDVSRGIPEGIDCEIDGAVNTAVPGVYRVQYTLTKDLNLTSYAGQAYLMVVVQE